MSIYSFLIKKALDVVNLELNGERRVGTKVEYEGYNKTCYCTCDKFILEMYDIYEKVKENSDKERFFIFTCVEGEGEIISSGVSEVIKKGDSFLIPAALGEYVIKGNLKVLKSYVP